MTILIVDNVTERLDALAECLRELFPTAQLKTEQDPFAAGKYCLFHPLDLIFTELEPGKMNALQLEQLIHHTNPNAGVYITGTLQSLYDWEILNEDGTLQENSVSGALPYPVTPEKLRMLLKQTATGGANH